LVRLFMNIEVSPNISESSAVSDYWPVLVSRVGKRIQLLIENGRHLVMLWPPVQ
jgi:hypothetical protein